MIRTRTLAAGLGALAVAVAAQAQTPAEPPTKLGFVDVERAVASVDEGKARFKELQDWARPRQEELNRLSKEIESLQGELIAKRGTASEDALAELNRRLVARQREAEDKKREAQRQGELKQEVLLKGLGERLNDVITTYADQNRFTAVFILKPNDVAYLANSADITEAVIKIYNQKYPFAGGAAPAGAAPSPAVKK